MEENMQYDTRGRRKRRGPRITRINTEEEGRRGRKPHTKTQRHKDQREKMEENPQNYTRVRRKRRGPRITRINTEEEGRRHHTKTQRPKAKNGRKPAW